MSNHYSSELLILPFRQGIRLMKPDSLTCGFQSIADILKSPFSVYFMNGSTIGLCNPVCAAISNNSPEEMNGKSIQKLGFSKSFQDMIIENNDKVLRTQRLNFFDETAETQLGEANSSYLSIKMPCYNEKNIIIGNFGISFNKQSHSDKTLSDFMQFAFNLKLSNNCTSIIQSPAFQDIYLTRREEQVAKNLIRGKTIKETAFIMGLSPRTVDFYFINLKNKMNVTSKSEFIDKCLCYFGITV